MQVPISRGGAIVDRRHLLILVVCWASSLCACGGGGGQNGRNPQAPAITSQSDDQSVQEGNIATFPVSVLGSGPLNYPWLNSVNGSTYAPIVLATHATYSIDLMNSRAARLTVTQAAPPSDFDPGVVLDGIGDSEGDVASQGDLGGDQ